ncbi:MAG: hypothetical protein EZS28_005040 [Streblomastix strix]|uniref:Uncharacterized protein n=1 Tax=Streblomastix strix TaxID=222440 RepID=A0A5J4WYZ1_9EUKA|nr:MAG: hypothetical protein EZS28_005040 [Streblomastix strix]
MRSIAQDILYDQIQAQAIAKNMINNTIGIGDPSLVSISNVNAQLASGIHNYKDIQPYLNYNALQNQPSQVIATKELPANQYKEREDIINEGTQKEKEEVLHQDKEFETENNQDRLDNDVLEDIPLAPSIIAPQDQKSLVQEQTEQDKIEDLQSQEMSRKNDAINYMLGSLDWGLNSINTVQLPQKVVSMRINDKIRSYIQMIKVLSKVEKVNQAKIKKNFISEIQMIATVEAQKELKKKYGKKQLKKKSKN